MFCICGIVLWLTFWGQIVNGESLKKKPQLILKGNVELT